MLKKVFVFGVLMVLCWSTSLSAECTTTVAGLIGENECVTWTKEGSPYCVDGDIMVECLEIEPGVIVEFLEDFVFQIKEVTGILTAAATAAEPILFKKSGSNTTGWQGILFDNTPNGSQMTQCNISGSINSGIRIINSLPQISSCSFIDNEAANGGGMNIVLDAVTEGLYLSGCKFNTNSATVNGGGIFAILSSGSLTMSKCEINDNKSISPDGPSFYGGGLYISSAVAAEGLTLNDCTISGNHAHSYDTGYHATARAEGGGLYIQEGTVHFAGCKILTNQASASAYYAYAYGGGVYNNAGVIRLTNTIVSGNTLAGQDVREGGGGIWNQNGTVIMENCTVGYNNNEGIFNNQGVLRIMNSIVYDNVGPSITGTAAVTYSDIMGGHDGEGNIDEYPDFVLPPIDLRLYPESPCVDAGNPAARYNDCVPPSHGTLINDMGAYGGPGACKYTPKCVGDLDGDGDCDGLDMKIFAGNLGRYDCDAHIPLLHE